MQQDGGTDGVEPASPHPSPLQTSLRAQNLPASFLRARGPALLAQAELHVRRVYPRDFRVRPPASASAPAPPLDPAPHPCGCAAPSSRYPRREPSGAEAERCQGWRNSGPPRGCAAYREGAELEGRGGAKRAHPLPGWASRGRGRRGRGRGAASAQAPRDQSAFGPTFLERLWAKRALPVSLPLLSCCFSLSSGLVQCRPHASSSLAFVKPLRLITTFSPSLTSFSQSSFTPTPLPPPPLSLLY